MQHMIDSLLNLIFNVYEAFTTAFYLREGDSDRIFCRSSVSLARSFDKLKPLSVNGTLPGWVIKHNEPLVITNFDKDESTLGYYSSDEDIKSFIAYPMEGKGVIVIDSKKKYAFTDKEKKILGFFAQTLHDELEREKKASEIEDSLEELSIQRRIIDYCGSLYAPADTIKGILQECMGHSGADAGFCAMERRGRLYVDSLCGVDDDESYRRRECVPGGSLSGVIFEGSRELILPWDSRYVRERPLLFPDESLKAKQLFGFPLMNDDIPIGVTGFVSLSDRPLKEQSIPLLRNAAVLISQYYRSRWLTQYIESTRDVEPLTRTIHFTKFLELIEEAASKRERFSLISIRLSVLQRINRTLGLAEANRLIARASDIIRHCAGTDSLVTRKGGGHFFVALKNTSSTDARNLMKIMHYTIIKGITKDMEIDSNKVVESGISNYPEDTLNIWDLFDAVGSPAIKTYTKEVGG